MAKADIQLSVEGTVSRAFRSARVFILRVGTALHCLLGES